MIRVFPKKCSRSANSFKEVKEYSITYLTFDIAKKRGMFSKEGLLLEEWVCINCIECSCPARQVEAKF
jgi:hypothetical protein